MTTVLLVFLAGGLGCLMRYGVVSLVKQWSPVFPLGTLLANVVGCFVFGVVAHWVFAREGGNEAAKVAVLVGLLGGFTTFSSFGHDTLQLWRDGHVWLSIGNVALNNVVGLGAAGLGMVVGRAIGAGTGGAG